LTIGWAEQRPRRDNFVDLIDLFQSLNAFDKAVQAGEIAVHLNPNDSRLAARVRNLSAESTMSRSGFDQTGQAGGYRANIRDSDTQRKLDEGERVVKTEEVLERLISDAKAAYEAHPADRPAIKEYARRLIERARPADIETALAVLDRAYKATQEVQFRVQAGDIRLRLARQRLKVLETKAKSAQDDPLAQEELEQARKDLTGAEIAEYEARVAAYPSDRVLKFELGKRLFDAGRYEDSIGLFQEAKGEPKQRVKVEQFLGHAFEKIAFHDGAIMSFRAALEGVGATDGELGMEIRYGLMTALQGKAEESGDLGAAEEADKLASGIAIQQFNYKDTRVRREQIKQLVARLKRGE
jgi:tetratricopeptide (TPR) repeat protein